MSRRLPERVWLTLIAVIIGSAWGLTMPVTKVAVSTGHQPLGLIFWQLAGSVLILWAVNRLRGQRLPWGRNVLLMFLFVAVAGTLIPNSFSYRAAAVLPAGIMSIVIASVPLFALPIGVALGIDRFAALRVVGLLLGMAGVALIALPEASLPEAAMLAMVPVALVAPFCYAVEGNVLAKWGLREVDPISMLLGASLIGLAIVTPLALATGTFINPFASPGLPEAAMGLNAALHACAYAGYIWLVGRSGAVFAAQVAYLTTIAGVLWSVALLNEGYSGFVWAALICMLGGMALVQPRRAGDVSENHVRT